MFKLNNSLLHFNTLLSFHVTADKPNLDLLIGLSTAYQVLAQEFALSSANAHS